MSSVATRWPAEWSARPLWSMFERVKDVGHPDEEMLSVYRDHGVIRKDSRDDNFNKTAENRDIYQLVHPGWLVVNRMKAWQGSLGVSRLRGTVSGHYLCFRPSHDEEPGFLNYLLRSDVYRAELLRLSRGVRPNQLEIDNDLLRTVPVYLPDREQQRRITGFLDAETCRVDELVAVKERMTAVLTERLRSSKLDDIARCKHLVPLKRVAELIDCKHRTPTYVDDGIPVVSPGDVTPGEIDLGRCHRFVDEMDFQDLSGGGRLLQPGDIVYSRNASVGLAGLVTPSTPRFCLGQDVCIVRPIDHRELSGRFLMHVLNTSGLRQIDEIKIGSTFSRINVEQVAKLQVPAVSAPTADELVRAWDQRDRAANETVDTLRTQIELLQERRRSLITAAVTGEMEVL